MKNKVVLIVILLAINVLNKVNIIVLPAYQIHNFLLMMVSAFSALMVNLVMLKLKLAYHAFRPVLLVEDILPLTAYPVTNKIITFKLH